jgi:phosphoglycerol transferase
LLFSFILCPTSYSLLKYSGIDAVFAGGNNNHVIDDYLVTPDTVHIPDKKNILYIYAESLERTYFDNDVFPGLLTGLRQIENRSLTFTNIQQIRGTGWTIAGITASQCGIPLITPSGGNSMSGMDTFLPLVICLGDVLSEENYQLSYLSGSSDEFAGTRKFFASHGFDEILGKDSLSEFLPDLTSKNGWGYYDDTVLDIAFEKFNRLSAQPKPFGLFISTMDTHHPNGHPSPSCEGKVYQEGTNPILNAVRCSDYLISNFINRVLESPYAEDT